jgi:glycerophosphoryl diester phosphodiesterase
MGAFELARARGLGAELDVRLSADGVAVVFHDADLRRMTGVAGRLSDRTAQELCALRLKNTQESPPLLAEVLEGPGRDMPLLIEMKVDLGREGPLEAAVADLLERHRGPVAVMSFNPASLAWFARFAPGAPRGMLADAFPRHGVWRAPWARRRRLRDYCDSDLARPDFLASSLQALTAYGVRRGRALNAPVLAWTIRTHNDIRRALQHADGFIFEHSGEQALMRRAQRTRWMR